MTARCGLPTAFRRRSIASPRAGKVTTYPLANLDAFPTSIVSGPDGALWFTETRGDAIGRITLDGQITEYPLATSGAFASEITVGPDGALWFTEALGNKVGRITPAGVVTEFPLATSDALPGPIVAGADGALWFGERNTNAITRMTTSGVITASHLIPAANADPTSLPRTARAASGSPSTPRDSCRR